MLNKSRFFKLTPFALAIALIITAALLFAPTGLPSATTIDILPTRMLLESVATPLPEVQASTAKNTVPVAVVNSGSTGRRPSESYPFVADGRDGSPDGKNMDGSWTAANFGSTSSVANNQTIGLVAADSSSSLGNTTSEGTTPVQGAVNGKRSSEALLAPEVTAALETFYNSTNGPTTWINKTGWLEPASDPCTWYGLVCDVNGLLRQINLEANGLSGTLPLTISDLSDLTQLDLTTNQIGGAIPTSLGTLTQMQVLSLAENQFMGGIPIELGSLTNLKELYLYTNQLDGPIPTELSNLSQLQILSLADNQFVGGIPIELASLTNLKELYLNKNLLTGPIPPELGNLTNLVELHLYSNQLTGSIPPELASLTHLETLSLAINQLTGPIPPELGNLDAMKLLELAQNQLTGSIPSELGSLPNLYYMELSDNALSGSIPASFGDLSNLEYLYLWNNHLSGPIPTQLGNLSKLFRFYVHANALTGPIPAQLGSLSTLTEFSVENNALSGEIPVEVTNLTNIIVGKFKLGFNMLTATNPAVKSFLDTKNLGWDQTQTITPANPQIGAFTPNTVQLSWDAIPYTGDGGNFQVSYATTPGGPYTPGCTTANKTILTCTVSGLTPATNYFFVVQAFTPAHGDQQSALLSSYTQEISASTFPVTVCDTQSDLSYSECQALGLLYNGTNGASWTNHTGWMDTNTPCTWFGVSCTAGHVSHLSLGENNLVGSLPSQISNLPNLVTLNLNGNGLTGSIPAQLGSLANLVTLNLNGNGLTGSIPTQLGSLTNLVDLSLDSNSLSGSIPIELGGLTSLKTLFLDNNNLTGSIPAQLGSLTALVDLSLDSNSLSGSIPTELGSLTNLKTLFLGGNALSGSIPAQLGSLTSLVDLSLDSNSLSGSIPIELGGLTSLKTLYLDNNNLTGSIPAQMGSLANLVTLNLNANGLTGSIPAQLGSLTSLENLNLGGGNSLSGSIPIELGGLASLKTLYLDNNNLTGSIPAQLGSLTGLVDLSLDSNSLSGSIPLQLGGLANLQTLNVANNALSGDIPPEFINLTTLLNLDLGFNMLTASDAGLITWLNTKQPTWASTQTIPPSGIQTTVLSASSIRVSWTPIAYTANGGYYEVGYSSSVSGPFSQSGCTTADKTVASCDVSGLSSNTAYYFAVRTFTPAHDTQQNALLSGFSTAVQGTTANLPPTANAGPDQTVPDFDRSGAELVTLDGSLSSDSDGTITGYSWLENSVEIATGVSPQVTLTVGTHTISLIVTDSNADQSTPDTVVITVNEPSNDIFANSIIINNLPYTYTQSNAAASLETGEQKGACEGATNIMKSVWFKYTAKGTENVVFTVGGSTVVKGISVWTGSSLGSLTQVGCGTGASASATVTTINGLGYYIRMGTSNGVGTTLTLQVTAPHGAPLRNSFTTPTPTLTWNRVTGATRYEIQVSKSSTFTTLVYPAVSVPSSQLSVTLPSLTEGIYYWRVRAIRGTTVGAWSAFDIFIVDLP